MSIVAAAIIPNSPPLLLHRTFNEKQNNNLASSLREVEGELYYMHPETILFITPAPLEYTAEIAAVIHQHIPLCSAEIPLASNMIEDHAVIDTQLITRIKAKMDRTSPPLPFTFCAPHSFPPTIIAPLQWCMRHLPYAKVIMIMVGLVDDKTSERVSAIIQSQLFETTRRIGIVFAGCLSFNATSSKNLETMLAKFAREHDIENIKKINQELWQHGDSNTRAPFMLFINILRKLHPMVTVFQQGAHNGATHLIANLSVE